MTNRPIIDVLGQIIQGIGIERPSEQK